MIYKGAAYHLMSGFFYVDTMFKTIVNGTIIDVLMLYLRVTNNNLCLMMMRAVKTTLKGI